MASSYELLGIPQTATKEQIKKAYRKLSLVYHPDRPTGNQDMFVRIKSAYEDLMTIKPEQVYRQHDQYEHRTKPYTAIVSEYITFKGDYHINVTFRNILYVVSLDGLKSRYSWNTYGLTDGTLIIKKKDLIACGYKFSLKFVPIIGSSVTKEFILTDPRGKFEKFMDKLKSYLS